MTNKSGLIPVGHRLVILPEVIEEVTKGGIIIAHETTHKEQMAQIKAKVIAIGDGAWSDCTTPAWCEVGDTILIGKFSGLLYDGEDGLKYRVINDLDVVCRMEK